MAKESKLRKMLGDGCIAEWYTLKGYFVRVYPAFGIDKVRFSFVEKGTKGQGFDVYVDLVAFMLLCEDIRSGALYRRIEADNGKFPAAWAYRTGENASKSVAIGKSQKGTPLIQGRDTLKKKSAQVPLLGYGQLREMALLFGIVSGQAVVGGHIAELKAVFDKAQASRRWAVTEDDEPTANQEGDGAPQEAEPAPAQSTSAEGAAARRALSGEGKEYVCYVLREPEERPEGCWATAVETQGKTFWLWSDGWNPMLDVLAGCAGQSRAVRLRIAVRGEGADRKAWLVS